MTTRTIQQRPGAALAAVAALALALAGCSGDTSANPSADASPDEPELGPLSQMFQDLYGDFDADSVTQQQVRMEQLVAECMAEQGWEYTPVDHSQLDGGFAPAGADDGLEWGTQEYAEQLGYGITTWENEEATTEPLPEGDEWQDPNFEYVESLSEAAREEYYEALHGPQPGPEDMESGEWEYDPANAGCYGDASQEVFAMTGEDGQSVFEDPKFEALVEDMTRIYEQVQDDPRIAELRSGWATCMADAGYPGLAHPEDAQEAIMTEHDAMWQDGEPDDAALEALQEKERATALADFRCGKEHDATALEIKILHEREQDFIDAHRAELEELLAAVRSMTDAAAG